MENIHTRIKSTRIGLGFSQAILADKTGVSQPTVANWENGSHVPRAAVLDKISDILKVSSTWLLTGKRDSSEIPSQIYLQTPICHVPIFQWPEKSTEISSAAPIGFMPYASRQRNLIGIMSDGDPETGFKVTICDPNSAGFNRTGPYLSDLNKKLVRIFINADDEKQSPDVYGRILAELTFYP